MSKAAGMDSLTLARGKNTGAVNAQHLFGMQFHICRIGPTACNIQAQGLANRYKSLSAVLASHGTLIRP